MARENLEDLEQELAVCLCRGKLLFLTQKLDWVPRKEACDLEGHCLQLVKTMLQDPDLREDRMTSERCFLEGNNGVWALLGHVYVHIAL